jgi:hypothetical protein
MIASLGRVLLGVSAVASLAAIVAGLRNGKPTEHPGMQATEKSADVEKATRRFLNFVLLPVWVVPGFCDYLCHRASKIERTSGTHESLTHMLMISSTGAGVAAAMFFEVNELVLTIMTASALTHEGVVVWDVGYAAKLRRQSPFEQHMHSFLEVLPFTALAFTVCLNPDDVAALFGRGKRPRRFRFERKRHPAPPLYLLSIVALVTAMLVVPYTEELLRCYRVDRTFLPHERPIDESAPR